MTWRRQIAAVCERYCGVRVELATVRPALDRLVRERAESLGLEDEQAYADHLASTFAAATELSHLVDALTNGQTEFFRDERQLAAVGTILAQPTGGPLRVWCAGCSTGEEPYSLAMLARERGIDCRVLATDINARYLQTARAGRYPIEDIARVEPRTKLHLERVGGAFLIPEAIAKNVTFERHNLVDPTQPRPQDGGAWDLIMCRNVFIYFHRRRVDAVVGRLAASLRPGGWLVLGATDPYCSDIEGLRVVDVDGHLLYRRATDSRQNRPAIPNTVPSPEPPRCGPPLRAKALPRDQDLDAARTELDRMLERAPLDVVARLSLGNVLLARHDFEGALREYDRVASLEPLMAEAHFFLGLTHRKLGDHESAKQSLQRALFLDLDFWPAAYLLASCLEREGRHRRAAAEFEHALRLLERGPKRALFRSRTEGLRGLELDPAHVAVACRRRLTG